MKLRFVSPCLGVKVMAVFEQPERGKLVVHNQSEILSIAAVTRRIIPEGKSHGCFSGLVIMKSLAKEWV